MFPDSLTLRATVALSGPLTSISTALPLTSTKRTLYLESNNTSASASVTLGKDTDCAISEIPRTVVPPTKPEKAATLLSCPKNVSNETSSFGSRSAMI